MKVDPRMIEPFNQWWRINNNCEPSLEAIAAFEAGFKAGLQHGVDAAIAIIKNHPEQPHD